MKHQHLHDCQSFKRLAVIKPVLLVLVLTFLAMPVYAACQIDSISNQNLNFTPSTLSNYHLADIAVTCDTGYKLGIDAGSNFNGTRRLIGVAQSNPISYTLYQGATATEWGSQTLAAANTYPQPALTGSIGTTTYQIYADVALSGNLPPDTYQDMVNVILADNSGATIATSQLNFNPTLASFCTLDTSGFDGHFGSYPVGSASPVTKSLGYITATCPNNIPYSIGINGGLNPSAGKRRMALGGQFIPYTVYYNSTEWGDGGLSAPNYTPTFSSAAAVTSLVGTGSPQNFPLSGTAWIDTATTVGTYTDTLIVTLVW